MKLSEEVMEAMHRALEKDGFLQVIACVNAYSGIIVRAYYAGNSC